MNCIECGKKMPKARMKALPDTKTCVKCSNLDPLVGLTSWDDGVPELIIAKESDVRNLRNPEITIL